MIEFIQSITESELRFIAKSDYGTDADDYYKSLKSVIFGQGCIMTTSQSYIPGEVISLCSNYPTEKHEREFTICNLLVIINRGVFHLKDSDLESKLEANRSLYRSLGAKYSDLILGAYRWSGF